MEYRSLPDMNSLATLKEVVERGGVSPAAQVLHVGQPAVTKRLRSLDTCYGVDLMHREGRRLELTPAGEKVYEYACLVLDHQLSLLDDIDSLSSGQNRLRLEVNFAIGEHMLPDLLLRFAELYPQYNIESRMGYSRHIQRRLATGLSDLALLEQAPDHPDILVQKWLDDELVLVCGPDHPLWGCGLLPVTDLEKLHYVLREARSSMRLTLDKALKDVGVGSLPVTMEVGSTDTIVEMLQHGRHVSFLPRFTVDDGLQAGSLYHIKIQGLRIKRILWIARTRSNLNNDVAEAFISLLRST
ncbi:MAG: LysR family transcriptional regulator [Candidatus Thiodiazotropha taylori]|nr:LysR family transcriptional regulator [Candidatus Thiodiazotropha taylori]MCG8109069.1 LysR family transcriptional regulator [Candidatus Thiodiazotropha taylori]MCG8111681.1 LysR family transcriptional regulator [Candidatus Thiodiazotropha taylori]MCW4281405.1 LysR family transcriptional regulator [Candidatus Thiodiazotropha taylori]MCW4284037.1 LysR family transcriptional regulator [Candidatus Thiodiazotropha taylori]